MSREDSTAPVEYRTIERFVGYRFGSDGSFWSRWANAGRIGRRQYEIDPFGEWVKIYGRIDKDGYINVAPRDATTGKHKGYRLSRLILEAFVGPCPPGMEARHFPDRNRTNNRIENLSWSNHVDNVADKRVHGTHQAGIKHAMAKLTEDQVSEIRRRFLEGATGPELAQVYGVHPTTIVRVAYGDHWKESCDVTPVSRPKVRRPRAKLTAVQVEEIRRLRDSGMKYNEIALLFGISSKNIGAICRGVSWKAC